MKRYIVQLDVSVYAEDEDNGGVSVYKRTEEYITRYDELSDAIYVAYMKREVGHCAAIVDSHAKLTVGMIRNDGKWVPCSTPEYDAIVALHLQYNAPAQLDADRETLAYISRLENALMMAQKTGS